MSNIERATITVMELCGGQLAPPPPPFSLLTSLQCASMTVVDDKVRRYSLCWRDRSNLMVLQPRVIEWEWHINTRFNNCILRDQWQDMHLLVLSLYFLLFLAPLSMYLFSSLSLISFPLILLSRKIHARGKQFVGRPSFHHWTENLDFYMSYPNSSFYGDMHFATVALILPHDF